MSSRYEASAAFGTDAVVERDFVRQVFAWMFLALAVTTGVAIWFHQSNATLNYFANHHGLFYLALFAPLVLVLVLRGMVASATVSMRVTAFVFFLYAGLMGLIFSILLDVYTTYSVVGAFAGATGVFGGMAVVGWTTNVDLTRFRGVLYGALIGIVVASFAFIFVGGSTFNLIIGYVGVVLFSAFTAYDIQQIKSQRVRWAANGSSSEKLALFGALRLYLDFINLFISLLRIFGGARR